MKYEFQNFLLSPHEIHTLVFFPKQIQNTISENIRKCYIIVRNNSLRMNMNEYFLPLFSIISFLNLSKILTHKKKIL